MDEKELLIKLSTLLEGLAEKVKDISAKVDGIRDGFISDARTKIGILETKVVRLESIIYGSLAVILAELIGLLFLWIKR